MIRSLSSKSQTLWALTIGGIDDTNELMRDSVERAENMEALTAGGSLDEGAAETPHHRQERSVDEVRGIDKIDLALAGQSLIQHRIQLVFLKSAWRMGAAFPGMGERRRGAIPKPRMNIRTWVACRRTPVNSAIQSAACAKLPGGWAQKSALITSACGSMSLRPILVAPFYQTSSADSHNFF